MSAFEIPGFSYSLTAAEDLRLMQFRGLKIDPTTEGVIVPTAGGPIVGVLQNKPNLGEATSIMATGITKMVASAASVPAGSKLAVDNAGGAVPAVLGNAVIGLALTSGGTGEFISVLLTGSGHTA